MTVRRIDALKIIAGLILMIVMIFSSLFMDVAYAAAKPALTLDAKKVNISKSKIEGCTLEDVYVSYLFSGKEAVAFSEGITVKNSNEKLVDAVIHKEDETGMAFLQVTSKGAKLGSAKITVTVPEMKSATVIVKVINPVTSIELSYPKNRGSEVAVGKSLQFKSTLISGKDVKPTIKKLEWTLMSKNDAGEWVIVPKNADKNVKLSANGKLSVKKKAEASNYRVCASTTDGTGIKSTISVKVYKPAKIVKASNLIAKGGNGSYEATKIKKNKLTLKTFDKSDKKSVYYVGIEYSADDYDKVSLPIIVDSSKGLKSCEIRRNSALSTRTIGDKHYLVYAIKPYEAGKNRKVTFLSTDGTNFKFTLNLTALADGQTAPAQDTVGLTIENGVAQPVFKYSDATKSDYSNEDSDILRFCAYVETDVDTDLDGKCDLVKVFLQVPRAACEGVYKAGVIYDPTPYNAGTRDDAGDTEDIDLRDSNYPYSNISEEQGSKRDVPSEVRSCYDQAMQTDNEEFFYSLPSYEGSPYETAGGYSYIDIYNYYLLRGFAVAESAGLGTYGSEGIETCGSIAEKIAHKNIVEWLNGKRVAYTDKDCKCRISATDFSNGNIAVTGCSYGGTLTYALATTGVEGIKTIIPYAGIASWYDYTNSQGQAQYGPVNYRDWLSQYCASRTYESDNRTDNGSEARWAHVQDNYNKTIAAAQISANAVYRYDSVDTDDEDFRNMIDNVWSDADYTKDAGNINCSALIVHGLNDFNVQRRQSKRIYDTFGSNEKRMILTQDAHGVPDCVKVKTKGYPEGRLFMELVNEWLCHYLYGIDNHILDKLAPVTVQSNVYQHDWLDLDDWEGDGADFAIAPGEDIFYDPASEGLLSDDGDDDLSIESQVIILDKDYKKKIPEAEIMDVNNLDELMEEIDPTILSLLDDDNTDDFMDENLLQKNLISKRRTFLPIQEWKDEYYLYIMDRNSVVAGYFSLDDDSEDKNSDFGDYYNAKKLEDGSVEILGVPYIDFKAKPNEDYAKTDRLMLTALLLDYSDEEFEAQTLANYSEMINTTERFYFGDGWGYGCIMDYEYYETNAKAITKGFANFCAPQPQDVDQENTGLYGDENDKLYDVKDGKNDDGSDFLAEGGDMVDSDGYYRYRVYMDPTAYNVAEGHILIPMIFTYDPNGDIRYSGMDVAASDAVPLKSYGFDIKDVSVHIPFAR